MRDKKLEEILSQNGIGRAAGERFNLGSGGEDLLKIKDVREAEVWIGLKRTKPAAMIVRQAERLTLPAQHAFLKTLEEPGDNILIVLTVDDDRELLPTIKSRCKIIRLPSGATPAGASEKYQILLKGTAGERLINLYQILKQITGTGATLHRGTVKRGEAIKFLESVIPGLTGLGDGRSLEAGVKAHRRLKDNLNPTLALHQFVMDISL